MRVRKMSKTTMMNSVSMLMTLVLQPVVLVLFFCEPRTFLPPDWGWVGYLAQSLQYVLVFA